MNRYFLTILCFLSSFLIGTAASADRGLKVVADLTHKNGKIGTYRALIIGIQDYNDPKISKLETPLNDALAMADILKDKYGFRVSTLLDKKATKKAIYNHLRDLTRKAKPNDSVLIYYAGHGDIDRTFNDGWWIPVDAVGGDPFTYLDNTQIQKTMASIKAKHVLLISDSCYSGTLFGQARAMPEIIDDKYYLNLYNEKSRWGITSGNKTPVSDTGSENHSVFAYQLIKKLKKNTKPYLSTQEIYTYIAPVIANNSEQQPLCRPIRGTGDMGGEFIFVSTSASSEKGKKSGSTVNEALEKEKAELEKQKLVLAQKIQELENEKLEQEKIKLELELEKLAQEKKQIYEEKKNPQQETIEPNSNQPALQIASIHRSDLNVVDKDAHFVLYKNGVVFDNFTELEWFQGPKEEVNWNRANNWVNRLNVDGGGWRMPSAEELSSLYKKGAGTKNMTKLLNPSSWWVWCNKKNAFSSTPHAYNFYYQSQTVQKYKINKPKFNSVIAVRGGNKKNKTEFDPYAN